MFSVEDGGSNPYTEMLFGEVNADLVQHVPGVGWKTLYRNVWLSYDEKSKRIHVHEWHGDTSKHLFDMKKDGFIRLYYVRYID